MSELNKSMSYPSCPYPDIRVGQGFDVHAFCEGDHVWLGGISIPHSASLLGHSDADVALHALTDAVLGALAEGDIGTHFPPSDPQWKGVRSGIFVQAAKDRVQKRKGIILHSDLTILCEAPKILPHRQNMRRQIASLLQIPEERVSVKATTTEKLGFTGRKEGIAAQAIVTLLFPSADPTNL